MILKNTLINYWREIHDREGYAEISTPIMLDRQLWETSGHWDHYKENMYTTEIDKTTFAIKPMNCPGGMLVYKSEPRSYRDLPMRIGELGIVHRHEKSGALHGLMRVRCFTQDDAHIFMTSDQITSEIKGVVRLIDEVYNLFGFKYRVELSTKPENSIGSDGHKHRPIMIHRVVFGSIERFIGILIEHYAGKFPTWLALVQVKLLPITDKNNKYADELCMALKKNGIRCEVDKRNEKTGFKIREAQLSKVPYMLVVGDKEEENAAVAVRLRDSAEI